MYKTRVPMLSLLIICCVLQLSCTDLVKLMVAADPSRTGPSPYAQKQSSSSCTLNVSVSGGAFDVSVEVTNFVKRYTARVTSSHPTCSFSLPCGSTWWVAVKVGSKVINSREIEVKGTTKMVLSSGR